MGTYQIGEALNIWLERSRWKARVMELRIREDWESIMGKTIARHTRQLYLKDKTLIIDAGHAVLRQELSSGKSQIIERINTHFQQVLVEEIRLR